MLHTPYLFSLGVKYDNLPLLRVPHLLVITADTLPPPADQYIHRLVAFPRAPARLLAHPLTPSQHPQARLQS